jgi:hypothetical protein
VAAVAFRGVPGFAFAVSRASAVEDVVSSAALGHDDSAFNAGTFRFRRRPAGVKKSTMPLALPSPLSFEKTV